LGPVTTCPMPIDVLTINTAAIAGQQPGTSGLRKKSKEFEAGNYLPNFVQSTFDACGDIAGKTLVVGGDGRYFNRVAVSVILKMAAANGVAKVYVAKDGILATPAASAVIRKRQAYGGFILTASHNPGGPESDWGIKWNGSNGGPASEAVTAAIYAKTQSIAQYKIAAHVTWPSVDLGVTGKTKIDQFEVEVIDSADDYVTLLKSVFDFEMLKTFVARPEFSCVFDAMNAVTGPYAKAILVDELGADPSSVIRSDPLEDFGGIHPDPNLTYAPELVKLMKYGQDDSSGAPQFGAASDGDGDRNMILGKGFFVSPSDSVAIIAANHGAIPYFKGGLKGVARSMPTSGALDRVATALGIECYETPTGWKFFGTLMDADKCSICGEESFGTGGDHVREKDGIWAILAWLSILASKNQDEAASFVGVADISKDHWATYGRNYYMRYDYEDVDGEKAKQLMAKLVASFGSQIGKSYGAFTIATADEFSYTDPVSADVTEHQGIRFMAADGSRFVFRLSGTGSTANATVRLYMEKYQAPKAALVEGEEAAEAAEAVEGEEDPLLLQTADALKDVASAALEISGLQALLGVDQPTVIT